MSRVWTLLLCAAVLLGGTEPLRDHIRLLYDEHAAPPLVGGWGYSALVEYHGRRILFDAGGNSEALAKNAKALGFDFAELDAVVISHDDPDHYAGLDYVYSLNPSVKVYVPQSESGAFSTSVVVHVLRFFQRAVPGQHLVDPPSRANYARIGDSAQIFPGVRLISLPFDGGNRREQALLLDVPGGVTMLTGCAHPGIVSFVQLAGAHVRLATGGFHLMTSSNAEVRRTVQGIKQAGVESVYPAHCTGRFATTELRKLFGARCGVVAVGGNIPLPR